MTQCFALEPVKLIVVTFYYRYILNFKLVKSPTQNTHTHLQTFVRNSYIAVYNTRAVQAVPVMTSHPAKTPIQNTFTSLSTVFGNVCPLGGG